MQKNKFDISTKYVLRYAGEYATSLSSNFVDIEHFMLGILKENTSFASNLLVQNGITTAKIITYIKFVGTQNILNVLHTNVDLSSDATMAIERALDESGITLITPNHLLMGVLKKPTFKTRKILDVFKVNGETLYAELLKKQMLPSYINAKPENLKKKVLDSKILNQYGKELVSLARVNLLDPVIGRDKEIDRLICILSRRRKNNPAIVGDAGVGKTAIVEGLAIKIAKEEVPDALKDKKIVSLDLSAIIAGTKYRGEFEERVKNIADECQKLKDVILFIDELHIIMGAGGAEGAIDAANILKPALSRSQIQIIGATTFEEYRKNIEKDTALERRFQKVLVSEPTISETNQILNGIKRNFEIYHKVRISQEAISSAVNLSVRYLTDRRLPDKAIDLIDEACANFNMKPPSKFLFEASRMIESADIENIISKYTGIECGNLDDNSIKHINNITQILKENIIGQDEACVKIISAVKRSKIGINDPNRPLGSFVFLGPTGVGKTEICKALALGLFGDEKKIIKVDMSEYMDKTSVTKLIGVSAGYIGYGENNAVTEKIRQNPHSLILFDEIEKAHPDVLNLLLQVLEDGILTDSQHRKINFKNTTIIMTSNIGADKIIQSKLGFGEVSGSKNDAIAELKKVFKPELLNRIDEIVVFNVLSNEDTFKITQNMIKKLQVRVANYGINIEFSDKTVEYVARTGYSTKYGARPIRRLITECIENPLTDKIINDEIRKGDTINVDYTDKINFEKIMKIDFQK